MEEGKKKGFKKERIEGQKEKKEEERKGKKCPEPRIPCFVTYA